MSAVDDAVAGIKAGKPVVLPTDTVYGLCADAYREGPVLRLGKLKRRPEGMPVALVAADVEALLDAVPELRGRAAVACRALLPGPYTLVLPNPARRFRWLGGTRPDTIGVRVPELPGAAREVLERVGAVAATSANLHGGPDPRRVDELAPELLDAVAAVVDAGELPGTPSTVLDLTGPEPVVLREGAVPAAEALSALAASRPGQE
ncbi:MAG TPA: L-threonylcarbamoyladenylate synthase [Gaiellaceae bacterium]|nr:L-threonylcarbamoyladenylate synthase [Gaiellaceae bacterium]